MFPFMQNQPPPPGGQYTNGTWSNVNSPPIAHNTSLQNNLNVCCLVDINFQNLLTFNYH